MARLGKEHKRFIVERLACFDDPSEIVEAVHEEFDGLVVTRQQVWNYDPTRPANAERIAEDLRQIFEATRKRFLEETADIGIAHARYRLERLQGMFRKAERMRNYGLAAQLLEQAAKEVGGSYTNRREVTGKDGGPVQQEVRANFDLAGDVRNIDREIELEARRAQEEEGEA